MTCGEVESGMDNQSHAASKEYLDAIQRPGLGIREVAMELMPLKEELDSLRDSYARYVTETAQAVAAERARIRQMALDEARRHELEGERDTALTTRYQWLSKALSDFAALLEEP